jgi:hypothetical protein
MTKEQFMATVAITVDLTVDIPNAKVSATVQRICDSMGQDRTEDFRKFCSDKNLFLSSQGDIEQAVVEFAKARQTSLP